MAEIIDFKTRKKIDPNVGFLERSKNCILRENETKKPCDCPICVDKRILANKLATISHWLCLDHMDKNKEKVLYWGDWIEVVTLALVEVQLRVMGNLNKK